MSEDERATVDVVASIDEALEWEANWEADAMRLNPDLPATSDGDLLAGEEIFDGEALRAVIAAIAAIHLEPMAHAFARVAEQIAELREKHRGEWRA